MFLLATTLTSLLPFAIPVVALIFLTLFLLKIYKVAEPNEALIISGMGIHASKTDKNSSEPKTAALGFKIVSGAGTFVIPILQTSRRLSLDQRKINIELTSVTNQSIPLTIRAVVIYKIADDYPSIANAARRFLGKQDEMDTSVSELSRGQLRTIVGSMTVEQLITDREALRGKVLTNCQDEMQKLGLYIDSFQIQEINDVPNTDGEPGYIENLGRPRLAEVSRSARIAEAVQSREATEKEAENQALIAHAQKESEVKIAQANAETEKARAIASQEGPLAEATARQRVISANTEAAELEAKLVAQKLEAEVRRPADAKAYETVTLAEADKTRTIRNAEASSEATKLTGEAEANVVKLQGEADATAIGAKAKAHAEGIKARNQALAENSDAVIRQQLAESYPEIVKAAANQYNNVDNMIVLDGAEGLNKSIASTIASASTMLPALFGNKNILEETTQSEEQQS